METWQQAYLDHIARISFLRKMPSGSSPAEMQTAVRNCQEEIRLLALENAALIREHLFPVLESIVRADDQTITELQAFAQRLTGSGRPDSNLALHIHESLLTAARRRHDRDLLIRELYECGLWSFYFLDNSLAGTAPPKYRKKIRLYFQEGASYLRVYDEIENTQTRGYIHRCMGNIALSYSQQEPLPKLEAINASLRILTDPSYHAKTPDLPWDRLVYSSHQERTTLLHYLRSVEATPEIASQVLESAQIVRNVQEERVRKQGIPLEPRWQYVYAGALFFSGITDIRTYLDTLIAISSSVPDNDYTGNGLFGSASIVAFFMDALNTYGSSVREEYSPQLTRLLRKAVRYMENAIRNPDCNDLYSQMEKLMQSFIEVSGGMCFRELFHALVPLGDRDLYIHSVISGKLCRWLAQLVRKEAPQLLAGLPEEESVLLELAEDAGLFHDVGLLLYPRNYITPIRLRLRPEEELRQLHTLYGWKLLQEHTSTRRCAWAALGHHQYSGYPEEYHREEDPTPVLTDLTVLADYLSRCSCAFLADLSPCPSVQERLQQMQADQTGQFRPELVRIVCKHGAQLPDVLQEIGREFYTVLWERFCRES